MKRMLAAVASSILLVVACAPAPARTPAPPAGSTMEAAARTPPPAPAAVPEAPTNDPAPAPTPEPPEPEPAPGSDHRSAAACHADADCGFDDPCVPRRCVGSHLQPDLKCAESAPPPGNCLCLAGRCTLEPHHEPRPDGPCEARGCLLDRAGGRCVTVAGGEASTSEVTIGPSCDCIEPAKGCRYTWHDPIPCRTERDCWVAEEPRPHPVRRPAHLRGRDFRPCDDGEIAPACSEDGHCTFSPLRFGC